MVQESIQHSSPQFSGSVGNQESGKHIVIALLIATAIVFGARQLADRFAHTGLRPVTTTKGPITAPSSAASDAAEAQAAAEARKQRQAREQIITEQERVRREQKKADVMRARDAAVFASQADEARKEAAWQHFFKPARKCDGATDDATRVDCSNQYIRARARFDKLYTDGKLP